MRKKAVIIVVVLVAGLLLIGPLLNWLSTEPKYQGRTVSYWFKQYYMSSWEVYGNLAKMEDAEEALRTLGTNAVPVLLTYYYNTNNDSVFQTNLVAFCAKLPNWLEVGPFATESIKREMAFDALRMVKPPEKFIVPLVTNHLNSADASERLTTLELLKALDVWTDAAMPILNQLLASANGEDQIVAIGFLSKFESRAVPAVPTLTKLLERSDTDAFVLRDTCGLLALLGHASSNAVPAVTVRFRAAESPADRLEFASVLCWIDARQPEAISFLVNLATNMADPLQKDAKGQLEFLGTNARSAAPLIAPLIEKGDSWELASTILLAIGETDLGLKHAEERVGSIKDWPGIQRALLVLQRDPTREWAITNLIEVAQDERLASALQFQKQMGSLSKSVDILLAAGHQIATNQNHPFQERAKRMLQSIEKAPPLTEEAKAREQMKIRYGLK